MPAPATSRRTVLTGMAGIVGGLAGCAGSDTSVSMLVAGSLNHAVENGLRPALDTPLRPEARGSAAAARLVADGVRDPAIVSLADTALFDAPLSADWYAEFATNELVLAYDADSEGGKRIAEAGAERWYRPLLSGDVSLGRTDPDTDPLGYRALFALELATEHYGVERDLREAVPERDQVYPETQLISAFETGNIDAALAYRNMAVERGYDYVALPSEINLSDPAHADRYATATYGLPGGQVVAGSVISYAATLRHSTVAARAVFRSHVAGDYLREFGFTVPDDYPAYTGTPPHGVA